MGSVVKKIGETATSPIRGMRDTTKAIGKGDWKGAMSAGMMQSMKPWIAHSKSFGIRQSEPTLEPMPEPTILAGPARPNKQRSLFGY